MIKFDYLNKGKGILAQEIANAIEKGREKVTEFYGFEISLTDNGARAVNMDGVEYLYFYNDYLEIDDAYGKSTLYCDWFAMDILFDIKEYVLADIKKAI